MSMLSTYLVCSSETIEKWADALALSDEETQEKLEAGMPLVMTLKNIGVDEFNILARCASNQEFDVEKAVGQEFLVREIGDEGPWVMGLHRPEIEAVAAMQIDEALVQRWVKNVAAFNEDERWCAENLTEDAANELKTLSSRAIQGTLPLFVCFFG